MVDLGQKKVNECLPFFMRQILEKGWLFCGFCKLSEATKPTEKTFYIISKLSSH